MAFVLKVTTLLSVALARALQDVLKAISKSLKFSKTPALLVLQIFTVHEFSTKLVIYLSNLVLVLVLVQVR